MKTGVFVLCMAGTLILVSCGSRKKSIQETNNALVGLQNDFPKNSALFSRNSFDNCLKMYQLGAKRTEKEKNFAFSTMTPHKRWTMTFIRRLAQEGYAQYSSGLIIFTGNFPEKKYYWGKDSGGIMCFFYAKNNKLFIAGNLGQPAHRKKLKTDGAFFTRLINKYPK